MLQFVCLIVYIIVVYANSNCTFGYMGERLTFVLRCQLYTETLYKQISWFDRQERAPGILTSVFSENMEAIRGMTSETLVKYAEAIFAFICGTVVGIVLCPS